jgi:hypothetical protein
VISGLPATYFGRHLALGNVSATGDSATQYLHCNAFRHRRVRVLAPSFLRAGCTVRLLGTGNFVTYKAKRLCFVKRAFFHVSSWSFK